LLLQEVNISSNSTTQQVTNSNINNLINIINKKQKLIKKIIIFETIFSFSILFAIATSNSKTNKTLNILTRVFKKLKINNAQNITKNEVY